MKVAVVGLGSTGLAVAAGLAGAGHEVWGFEQNGPTVALGSSRGDTRIYRLTPGEGPLYVGLAEDADRRWRLLEEFSGRSLIDRQPGYMAGPPESEFVESCVRLSQEHERDYALMDAADVSAETEGWVRLPPQWKICRQDDCGVIDAPAALLALAKKAAAFHARLAWNTRIDAPVSSSRLRVDGDWLEFDRVILAAGPWMREVAPETASDLTVARRVLAWFAPIDNIGPPRPMPILCLDDRQGTYAMQALGGWFKIGAHVVGDAGVAPDNVAPVCPGDIEPIATAVRDYLPRYDARPMKTDACLYTMTEQSNFLIFEIASDSNVLCMSCCSGHGFKYAPAFGGIALNWVEGRDDAYLRAFGKGLAEAPAPIGLKGAL
jgi:sarcosine oxidase